MLKSISFKKQGGRWHIPFPASLAVRPPLRAPSLQCMEDSPEAGEGILDAGFSESLLSKPGGKSVQVQESWAEGASPQCGRFSWLWYWGSGCCLSTLWSQSRHLEHPCCWLTKLWCWSEPKTAEDSGWLPLECGFWLESEASKSHSWFRRHFQPERGVLSSQSQLRLVGAFSFLV